MRIDRTTSRWGTGRLAGPALVAAGALFLSLLAIQGGMGVTPDGLSYLDVADDILDGSWFSDPTFSDPTHFPPGLSLAIASISALTGMTTTAAAGLVNATAMAGVVLGGALYLRRRGTPPPMTVLAVLLLGVSAALLRVNVKVLTETAFVACLVATVIGLDLEQRRPGRLSFALLAVACTGAALLRYPGVAVGLAAAVVMLLWDRSIRGLRRATGLLAAGTVPLIVWVTAVGESGAAELRGHSPSSERTFGEVAHSIAALGFAAVGGGYEVTGTAYGRLDVPARAVGAAIGVALFGLMAAWSIASAKDLLRNGRAARPSSAVAVVVVLYVSVVAVIRFVQGYTVLDRYWLPALVLGLLALLSSDRVASRRHQHWLVAGLVVLIGSNLIRSVLLLVDRSA